MKFSMLLLISFVFMVSQVQADSVYQWGHWQSDESARKKIAEGADPSDVTEAPEAGISTPRFTSTFNIYPDNPNISPEGLPRRNTPAVRPSGPTAVSNRRGNGGLPTGGLLP